MRTDPGQLAAWWLMNRDHSLTPDQDEELEQSPQRQQRVLEQMRRVQRVQCELRGRGRDAAYGGAGEPESARRGFAALIRNSISPRSNTEEHGVQKNHSMRLQPEGRSPDGGW